MTAMPRRMAIGVNSGNPWKTARRLLGYVVKDYALRLVVVLGCIVVSAAASVAGSLFLRTLIDKYITPLTGAASPDFGPLFQALTVMAAIYLGGILANLAQNLLMVRISQGVQKDIRDSMFSGMQRLPVSYFDSHSYGDLMSRYTNDIDTPASFPPLTLPTIYTL